MVYQPTEELLPKVDYNIYKLTTIAFKRAQELAAGQPKLIESPSNEKLATTALKEIRAGKVVSKEYAEMAERAEKKK